VHNSINDNTIPGCRRKRGSEDLLRLSFHTPLEVQVFPCSHQLKARYTSQDDLRLCKRWQRLVNTDFPYLRVQVSSLQSSAGCEISSRANSGIGRDLESPGLNRSGSARSNTREMAYENHPIDGYHASATWTETSLNRWRCISLLAIKQDTLGAWGSRTRAQPFMNSLSSTRANHEWTSLTPCGISLG